MSTSATVSIKMNGSGTLINTGSGAVVSPTSQLSFQTGNSQTGQFQSMDWSFTSGSSSNQILNWYYTEATLAATSAANVDLQLVQNELGVALGAVQLKAILLRILNPDGTMAIQIGPSAGGSPLTNAWVGNLFNSNTHYMTIKDQLLWRDEFGETVSSTTKILGIYNPGANPVTYDLWVLVS